MNSVSGAARTEWRDCYMAALFEQDKTRVPALIAHAESEIVCRARSLFGSKETSGEIKALDNALHMLQVLKSCLKVEADRRVPV
jgi:hypothetical protein